VKISDITVQDLIEYAHESNDDTEIVNTFTTILSSVKAYIKGYTGLTVEEMDTKEDLVIALMVLSNELYDNRAFTVQNDKANTVVKSILDMHSVNLL
jgi:hypothetical protein